MADATITDPILMGTLLQDAPVFRMPQPGSTVTGAVISIGKNKILLDINGFMTGIISGKESTDSLGTIKDLKPGDKLSAYVIEAENNEGLAVLSLRKASQEKTWDHFMDAFNNSKVIAVTINEANKGGLLLNVDGIKGFIPVSQLAPMHYPRVGTADSSEILSRLEKLIGQKIDVKIINLDQESGKLILSEKSAQEDQRKVALTKLKVGEKMKGRISGIVNFGIFVTFNGLEGLVHISEIAWGHVKDPRDYGALGQDVDVEIIGIEGEKISLSMKRLMPDPWSDVSKKFPTGKTVKGIVTRVTPFGVFVKLEKDINGLVHISELTEKSDPTKTLKVGDTVTAKIINVDMDEHRIGLTMKDLDGTSSEEKAEKKESKKEKTEKAGEKVESLEDLGLSEKIVKALNEIGINNIDDLKSKKPEDLQKVPGIGPLKAKKLLEKVS